LGDATVITLRSSFLAAAGLALSLMAALQVAQAGPAMSEWSATADYDQDSCAQRAQASFAANGWQSVQPNGYSIMADRGPLAGVIVCLPESLTQSIPVGVVSGGDGNAASDEADRLKYQMLGR
jgi:opacity protein-like surface antigen